MAIIDVVVPQLSESISEASLLEGKKKVGEAVNQDETRIEVETDKVVLEVPAPASGVLTETAQGDGATVTSGQVLAKIDTEAKAGAAAPEAAAAAPAAQPAAAEPAKAEAAPAKAAEASKGSAGVASPAASKILSEKGIAAGDVEGSGRDGRVPKADAAAASAKPAAPAPAAAAGAATSLSLDGRPEQRVPMTRLRARIAERLIQSQQENAILTTFNEVNMKAVIDLRNAYKDRFEKEHGVKLGF